MKNLLFSLFALLILFSCKKEKENPLPLPVILNDIFIINEGAFGTGNATISFYERSTGHLTSDIFQQQNQIPLGDVALSMNIFNGRGFIVVNNSQKVEVVSMGDFKRTGTINNLSSPRFFLGVNVHKGYVTDWISNTVAVVDLNSYQIIKTIPTGSGPEQMVNSGNKIYVTNVGGFDTDSTITVINSDTDVAIKTLVVGKNPNSIVKDKNGMIWILCNGDIGPDWIGGTADDIAGELIQLNPANDSIERRFIMSSSDHPMKLTINRAGDQIYFLNGMSGFDGKVYTMHINDNSLPTSPMIDKTFYGLGIDPASNNILGAFVPGFSQKGYMFRYSGNGGFLDSIQVGIAPNGFSFN